MAAVKWHTISRQGHHAAHAACVAWLLNRACYSRCILGRRDWQTKCLFSRHHMQAAGNEPLLTSSRQCGWDKFIENSNRSSGLQHNDQMRL